MESELVLDERKGVSILRSCMSWISFYWGRLRMDWLGKCLFGLRSVYNAKMERLGWLEF